MNATATKKTTMTEIGAMWKRKSKKGTPYYSGKTNAGMELVAFYNTNKKDLKEPDLKVYTKDREGNTDKKEWLVLWCNSTKDGKKKYLSGKLGEKRVVGFFNPKATEENKQPYFHLYYSEDKPQDNTQQTQQQAKAAQTHFEEIGTDDDLPF